MRVLAELLQKLVPLAIVADEAADGDARDVIASESCERFAIPFAGGGCDCHNQGNDRQNAPNRKPAPEAAPIDQNIRIQRHAPAFR